MGKYYLVTNSDMYDRGNQTKKRIVLNVHCTISNAKVVLHENIQKIPCSHKSVLINLITR